MIAQPWQDPPPLRDPHALRRIGWSRVGRLTNDELGAEVEDALAKHFHVSRGCLGRTGAFDLFDEDRVYEVKACSTYSGEYKAKLSKVEHDRRRLTARRLKLKPFTIIAVVDPDAGLIHPYLKRGVGSFRLTTPARGWSYLGPVALPIGDPCPMT